MLDNITFQNPIFLWFLIIIPILLAWYIFRRNKRNAEIRIASTTVFKNFSTAFKIHARHSLFAFRLIALALILVALARPQTTSSRQESNVEGIDIVMALDISSSMKAEDFKPNRLEASKNVASDFIKERPNDRVGLVVFAGESFTQCPLTTDHQVVTDLFKDVKIGIVEDGTAIGNGLATAINRLKDSQAVSKVIILLTDGENNSGTIDPVSAAEIAAKFGIRVYTIGVGSLGTAPYPFETPFGIRYEDVEVKIDEDLLQQIAQLTDGQYFRASNNRKLEEIYAYIDKLEKSKIDITEFHKKHEEFFLYALIALLLLVAEFVLRTTYFRNLP